MTRRLSLKTPRNQPRQPRSRMTVSVILDAAVRVLEQDGWDALTTSRVAEVAGVSVGTLYQYFATFAKREHETTSPDICPAQSAHFLNSRSQRPRNYLAVSG